MKPLLKCIEDSRTLYSILQVSKVSTYSINSNIYVQNITLKNILEYSMKLDSIVECFRRKNIPDI